MANKNKITSVQAITDAMQAASKPIAPPACVPLDDSDLPFFEAVVAEFARAEWTEHSLQLAANLARMMADLTNEQIALREEGTVAHSEKGTPVINPRKTAVQMYAGSILSIRRSLSLHARAQGEPRDEAKRRGAKKAAQDAVSGEDNLIGGMTNNG